MKTIVAIFSLLFIITNFCLAQLTVKDRASTPHILMQVNDEGSAGSIYFPYLETFPGDVDQKLYNYFGKLYWNGNELGHAYSAGGWTNLSGKIYPSTLTDNVGIGVSNPMSLLSVGGAGNSLASIYCETNEPIGYGVKVYASGSGEFTENYGGYFHSNGRLGAGVYGYTTGGAPGIYGYAASSSGWGIRGEAEGLVGRGVYGHASSTDNAINYGGYFESEGAPGNGVCGIANGSEGIGVLGYASKSGIVSNYGGKFEAEGENGFGIHCQAPLAGWAGWFEGDEKVTNNLYVDGNVYKSGGSFKIDHPLDPTNKYLYHSFVESPDMMNIYNGNVKLDVNGEAEVDMPDWFEALNMEFRYLLTCIGGFAPVYISEEILDNQFKISGGSAGMKVSWQVTGIRQDAFANANRIPVEELKEDKARGKYLHPELFNMPKTASVNYEQKIEDARIRMEEERRTEVRRHAEEQTRSKENRIKME